MHLGRKQKTIPSLYSREFLLSRYFKNRRWENSEGIRWCEACGRWHTTHGLESSPQVGVIVKLHEEKKTQFDCAIGSPWLSTITNLHTQLWWEQGSWHSCIHLGTLVQPVHRPLEQLSKAQTWIPCPHRVNLQLSKHIVMILLHYQKQLFAARSRSIFFLVLFGTQKDQSNIFKQRKFGKKSNLINLEIPQRSTMT